MAEPRKPRKTGKRKAKSQQPAGDQAASQQPKPVDGVRQDGARDPR